MAKRSPRGSLGGHHRSLAKVWFANRPVTKVSDHQGPGHGEAAPRADPDHGVGLDGLDAERLRPRIVENLLERESQRRGSGEQIEAGRLRAARRDDVPAVRLSVPRRGLALVCGMSYRRASPDVQHRKWR